MSQEKLAHYKSLIDADIAEHSQLLLERWQQQFGLEAAQVFDAYLSVLSRGGKRLRGSLAMWAYYHAGGQDEEVALRAGRLLEMIHAYLLVVDDIADESNSRRGGLSAHKMIENYHKQQKWFGSSAHFGSSQAMNGSLAAQHSIMQEMTELPISDSIKLEALRELSAALVETVAGQIADINNQAIQDVSEKEVIDMMSRKTATYSFVSPLQLGIILAGGDFSQYDSLKKWALNIGLSFQIRDDILGVFGDETLTGKSNLDDLKEGKATLLIVRALHHARFNQKKQLLAILGNSKISSGELQTVQTILSDTGALDYTKSLAKQYTRAAIESLASTSNSQFLEDLTNMITDRQN